MNKVKLYSNKALRLSLLGAFVLAATACSHSGGSASSDSGGNGASGDASTLQVITPKTIYSKPDTAGSAYVVINNPTNTAVKNLHYSLTNPIGSASKAVIDPVSAASCSTVAAYSQCNVKVSVTAGAVAGSIGFSLSNNSTLLGKLTKSAQAAALASTMGIEQAAYNSLKGADGITLSYYNTVINGTPYILVSGLVASNNAGSFDKVVLVNGSGAVIPNQQLINPVSSAQGSTFNILLPVPSANNATQTIKVQTQQNNTVVSTATASSTLTTQQNIGIANMLPSAVYLTSANPEQIITFANTGDVAAQLQQLVSNNPNVEVTFSPSSLQTGATATATLKLKNTAVSATSGNVTLSYNNGQSQTSTSGSVDQNVDPAPSPKPTPTPTPTPGPAPAPTAGLTAELSPNSNFFTTTVQGSVSRQMTISNTGSTDEDNIVLALPANFSISSGTDNSCTVTNGTSPATISDDLVAGTGSCDVTVSYNYSALTTESSGEISIAYKYNSGTAAPTPATAPVNYRVTQSTAVLSLTNPWSPYNFINIASDNTDFATQTFTLYNSGEVDATNVAGSISPASIFTILSNYSSIIAAGASGDLNLQFGPSSTLGANATTLTVTYDDYPTHAATPVTVDITGSVSNAIAYLQTVAATGFAGGNGQTATTAYALQTGSNGQVTLTYKNKGNEPALNFNLTSGTISSKLTGTLFTLVTDGCNLDTGGKTLAANETCDEVLQYSPTAAGATTLPLNTPNWQFSYGDTHGSYTYNSAPVYFNAYAPASIAITTTGLINGQVPVGGSFQINAALAGGYQVPNQTIALQNLNPADANINTSNTCQVSSTTNQCSINVPVGSSAVTGSYTLDVVNQTGGATITSGSPVAFNVTPVNYGSFLVCNNQSPYSCYRINDSGSWTLILGSTVGGLAWGGLASSSDSSKIVTCNTSSPFGCFISNNFASWTPISSALASGSLYDGNLTLFDNGNAIACNQTSCYSSLSGTSWNQISQGSLSGGIQFGGLVIANSTNNSAAVCTSANGCYYSTNNAAWVKINGSINGGIDWSTVASNGGKGKLYACNDANQTMCYYSDNFGAWSSIAQGNWVGKISNGGLAASNTSDLAVACNEGSPFKCFVSKNHGSWSLINGTVSGSLLYGGIAISNNVIVACNSSSPFTCYKSIDGNDWVAISGTVSGGLATQGLMANSFGVFLACNSSNPFTCYNSINGGAWQQINGSTSGGVRNAGVASDLMNFKGHG